MQLTHVLATLALASVTLAIPDTSSASVTSTALSPAESCVQKCGTTDICCQAACVNVPCPSGSQVNATTECAAKCPQGNGTEADTSSYASCQQSCISSLFFPIGATAGAGATGTVGGNTVGSAEATATGTAGSNGAGASGQTGSGTASATGSHATGGANEVRFGAAGAGLLALLAAGLAL